MRQSRRTLNRRISRLEAELSQERIQRENAELKLQAQEMHRRAVGAAVPSSASGPLGLLKSIAFAAIIVAVAVLVGALLIGSGTLSPDGAGKIAAAAIGVGVLLQTGVFLRDATQKDVSWTESLTYATLTASATFGSALAFLSLFRP